MINSILLTGSHALATFRTQRTIQTTLSFGNRVFFRKAQLDLPEVALTLRDRQLFVSSSRFLLNPVRLWQ
jgi:hypothetical protein